MPLRGLGPDLNRSTRHGPHRSRQEIEERLTQADLLHSQLREAVRYIAFHPHPEGLGQGQRQTQHRFQQFHHADRLARIGCLHPAQFAVIAGRIVVGAPGRIGRAQLEAGIRWRRLEAVLIDQMGRQRVEGDALVALQLPDTEAERRRHLRLAELVHESMGEDRVRACGIREGRDTGVGFERLDRLDQRLLESWRGAFVFQRRQVDQRAVLQHAGIVEPVQYATQLAHEGPVWSIGGHLLPGMS